MGANRFVSICAILLLSGCTGGFEAKHTSQSSNTSNGIPRQSEPMSFSRSGLPEAVQGTLVLGGSCEAGQVLSLSIDGAAPVQVNCADGSFSYQVALPGPDGLKTIVGTQTGKDGRESQDSISVMKDTTPPSVAIVSATAAGSGVVVNGTCENGLPVSFGRDITSTGTVMCSNGIFQTTVAVTAGSGSKTLEAAQSDKAGNRGSATMVFNPSVTPPPVQVTIAQPAANAPVRTSVVVSGACQPGGNVTLAGSGVQTPVNATCANALYSQSVTLSANDGNKLITAAQGSSSASVTVIKDTVAPNLTITEPAAGTLSSTGVTIKGACETGLSVTASGNGVASNMNAACTGGMYSVSVVFSAGDGVKNVTLSQTDAAGNTASVSRAFEKGAPILDGVALYTQNCASCHGALNVSTKRDRTAAQISGAISSVSSMAGLKTLTTQQVAAIADALKSPPVDPMAQCTDPGFEPIHRLNENEYKNTLRDLLKTQVQYSMPMPLEYGLAGFYNNAKTLDITEDRMEAYFTIAAAVVNEAFTNNRASIMVCTPAAGQEAACASQILRPLAQRAFRRPVAANDADLAKLVNFATLAKNQGDTFETGIRQAIQAMLVSPRFLFRTYAVTSPSAPRSLDGYELASRLSYFLWSSMPDDELLAAAPTLNNPDNLKTQLTRMLASTKSDGFIDNFMRQWLSLKMLDESNPDSSFFPGFTAALKSDMAAEVRAMLKYMLTQNLSLKELLTARYSFLNERLAAHYGVAGVTGSNLRLVNFTSQDRAGIIGTGGVLTMTSHSNRTSVVRRGFWVLNNLLCDEPPPPPADVPPLPPTGSQPQTLRERMQAHTTNAACISCHAKMDQYGFSLENFDGVGKFRTTENGLPIDNRALLPEGESFAGLSGLSDTLTKSAKLDACLSKRLLTYAIGRQMTTADACVINKVAGSPAQRLSEQKMSDVLLRVITSDSFTKIRGE